MKIGEKMEKLMEEKRLWPSKLTHILTERTGRGYDSKKIFKIIAGEKKLNEKELQAFSGILRVTKGYLVDDKKGYPPSDDDRTKECLIDLKMDIRAVTSEQKTQELEEEMKRYELPPMIGKIPIVGCVSAGETENAYGDAGLPVGASLPGEDPIDRPRDVTDPNAYGLIITGDSMRPGYPNGTKVVVCPNRKAKSGDIAIVRLRSTGKVYVKEIDLKGDNVSLTSHNFINYSPIQVSVNDIHFMHPVAWFKRP